VQSFLISSAAIRDCKEWARLLVGQLGEHGVGASAGRLSHLLEAVVANPDRGFVLLARVDERIVGVAYAATILSIEHSDSVAWLEELYVAPSYRLQGIGSALLAAVVERALEAGVVAVDLEVDASHMQVTIARSRYIDEWAFVL
jgi:GNAT superfamily N-acetyltransferase